jgi:predicted enzyme related to lactoylglutathione lyase
MSTREGYEPGVPCWVSTVQFDADQAVDFYTELLGWEATNLMPPDAEAKYFLCTLDGKRVASVVSTHGAPPPPSAVWGTYMWVDDADRATAAAVDAGGAVIGQPFDSPGDGRMAVLADPAGAVFGVWQPRSHRGAEVVNEPGAWAMSMLMTPDPEGATAFYGAVFGWEPMGFGPATLFRQPGYVGGEPSQPVPRDVIAAMAPLNGSGGPPHWAVDFWISDVDAAAAKAEQLGGTVVVPVHDEGDFRRTTITDPQGATMSLSQLIVQHRGGR